MMAIHHTPGLSVVVADHGRILWAKAYGFADLAAHKKVQPGTLFQAASISKPVAASAAMQLVQEGKLSLDADANTELKSWRIPDSPLTKDAPITLRGLLTHTAGLTVHGFPGYAAGEPIPTLVEVIEGKPPANTPPVVVDHKPGTNWSYSGGGISIAQLMMIDATGETFPALMQKRVLGPAGMSASTYEQPLPAARRGEAAHAYLADGTAVKGAWHTYPEMAAAGLWTTPGDLAKWAMALQDAYAGRSTRLMSQASAKTMLTPGLGDWGIGIEVKGEGEAKHFSHSGGNFGFRSYLVGWTSGGHVIAVMDNGDDGYPVIQAVTEAIARHYGWTGYETKLIEAAEVSPGQLAEVAGRYGEGAANLLLSGKTLVSVGGGGPPVEMIPVAGASFVRSSDGMTVSVERGADGKITGLRAPGGLFLPRDK
jgi:CubicO group peptidase (beta-lactamase class C family)